MLRNNREYTDKKYLFELVVVENVGYLVKVTNVLENYQIKQYFTKDDETALDLFGSLLDCYEREGEHSLLFFNAKERLNKIHGEEVEVNIE